MNAVLRPRSLYLGNMMSGGERFPQTEKEMFDSAGSAGHCWSRFKEGQLNSEVTFDLPGNRNVNQSINLPKENIFHV